MNFEELNTVIFKDLDEEFVQFISNDRDYVPGFIRDAKTQCFYRNKYVRNIDGKYVKEPEFFGSRFSEGFLSSHSDTIKANLKTSFIEHIGNNDALLVHKDALLATLKSYKLEVDQYKIKSDVSTVNLWINAVEDEYNRITSLDPGNELVSLHSTSTSKTFKFKDELKTSEVDKILAYLVVNAFSDEDINPVTLKNFLGGDRSIFPSFILLKRPIEPSLACIEYLRTQLVYSDAHNRLVKQKDIIRLFRTQRDSPLRSNTYSNAKNSNAKNKVNVDEDIFRRLVKP